MRDDLRTTTITKTILFSKKALVLLRLSVILLHLIPIIPVFCVAMNIDESDELRRGFLHRFGLANVPIQSAPSLHIPQHIWDIYDADNHADWVRHYYPKEIIENNSGFILSYNLSAAARNAQKENVLRAILKLRFRYNKKNGGVNDSLIAVYTFDERKTEVLVDSRRVEQLSEWIDFDVSLAFSRTAMDEISFIIKLADGIEIDETHTSSLSSLPYAKAQSAPLVVFSDNLDPINVRTRRKRNAQTGNSERKNRRKGRKHQNYEAPSNLCRKTELYVDFDELGWQDWIMAPKGYEAGQCQGSCPNPIPAQLNASNHAIIQSLLHSLNPDDVPAPCCVPTETSPLSILYMDTDNVIVIKEYADMRVEACGCR